ncbi:uncharacterized protein B0I36DRAFT_89217 [Microdochium trichocladiopsis]|uniref:Uncharacterized protein n=1 Tax=Microdochium trichocladiopsis TaxID=1682393 RepID=A0A9P9BQS3_9PEZI|nr:uncharacterized protein B0I36DRAFT_89217 [Microdochium trichocladiopsis]KAH7035188.1 hypothetical protein B0I36DRAFT_89217 [Microdochium trichocladiopsis]
MQSISVSPQMMVVSRESVAWDRAKQAPPPMPWPLSETVSQAADADQESRADLVPASSMGKCTWRASWVAQIGDCVLGCGTENNNMPLARLCMQPETRPHSSPQIRIEMAAHASQPLLMHNSGSACQYRHMRCWLACASCGSSEPLPVHMAAGSTRSTLACVLCNLERQDNLDTWNHQTLMSDLADCDSQCRTHWGRIRPAKGARKQEIGASPAADP